MGSINNDDQIYLKQCFELAVQAKEQGIHPFSAILVSAEGEVLLKQINGYLPNKDMTGHAERLIMTEASQMYRPEYLKDCTLYISAEPCAMCAGAIYWAGVGRVVYGLSESKLKQITGNHPENPTLDLPCRTVFSAGQRPMEIIGPIMEAAAARIHDDVW
ncbi:nucleoside deaminase [Vibrio rumoiensis]|uniref:tRNA-specific adenosine deaminase n=1 Tax=Vibrio rumoiensis 1S-45 TaxID=1188252 RepID=A0A1E5E2A5_9VIBR|nr:nucleoside deaminase [Vibrio rumoiensis]OEF25556.1 tRNA-specific adenosine deaminase [Vibrio rumoiensis 1S-45]